MTDTSNVFRIREMVGEPASHSADLYPLTAPLTYTVFPDKSGQSKTDVRSTWGAFVERVADARTFPSKAATPFVKLAAFGDQRSTRGSYKTGDNMGVVYGVEGDYDSEIVSVDEAEQRMRAARVECLIVTTASHGPGAPRWRVFAPLARPCSWTEARVLVAVVNGMLGGILAGESFTVAQGYHVGRVEGVEYEVRHVRGSAIDDDLFGAPVYPPGKEPRPAGEIGETRVAVKAGWTLAKVCAELLPLCDAASGRDDWLHTGMALHHEYDGSAEALDAFDQWSKTGGDSYVSRADVAGRWRSFGGTGATPRTLHGLIKQSGWKPTDDELAEGFEDEGEAPAARDEGLDTNLHEGVNAFYAYLPQNKFLHRPTGALWPAESVDGSVLEWPTWLDPDKKEQVKARPSKWLTKHRAVQQMSWIPGLPEIVENCAVREGGVTSAHGNRVFNLYRAPDPIKGDATRAGRWLEHLRTIYPDDAAHIVNWLAHRIQRPYEKLNHALVLGGNQGIGKDTVFEPVRHGIGTWNWQDVSPAQVLGRFNGWVKGVVVRVSEARDLGDSNRHVFYEATKVVIAAPPEVLRVDEKNLREHYVPNTLGMIITTNHRTDGLYLPADDRRHYVAWSDKTKDDFSEAYWSGLWKWYEAGGTASVVAYLASVDLSTFNPKAPPPKTQAFWIMVSAGEAPENNELRDLIDSLPSKDAFTLGDLTSGLYDPGHAAVRTDLLDRRNRRQVPHKLARVGYVPVRNPDAADGAWSIGGARQSVYARQELCLADQVRAARRLSSVK